MAKRYIGKRYVVTANVGGQPQNEKFRDALLSYCKLRKAKLLVVETLPYRAKEPTIWEGIPLECRLPLGHGGMKFNNNCRLAEFAVRPATKDPTSSITPEIRETIIVASPKQIYKSIPNMDTLPRAIICTGSINMPVYDITANGSTARNNHLCGAYIIEVKDSDVFFPRNIQAFSDGSFVDAGIRYYPNGKTKKLDKSEIVRVDGDDHTAEMDPNIDKLLDELQKEITAFCKVSHDTWSQKVSNHHNEGKNITKARSADHGGITRISEEADLTRKYLENKTKIFDEVVVTAANHNEALDRMLEEARYIFEDRNWLTGTLYSLAKYYRVNPVEFATAYSSEFTAVVGQYFDSIRSKQEKQFKLTSKSRISKVKFLKEGQSYKFGGIELAYHGDDGAHGAKGSPKAMRTIHGASVTAHTHVPNLYNKTAVVGTSTHTPDHEDAPDYAKGKPSAWMNSFAFVYAPKDLKDELGSIQLCNIIHYEWRLLNKKSK